MVHFLAAGSMKNSLNMSPLESGEKIQFGIASRRYNSSSPHARLLVFGSLGMFTLAIAGAFVLVGAWPVAPFAGLECLALLAAYRWLRHHDEDYELITIEGDDVIVETRNGSKRERVPMSRFWAQVVIEDQAGGKKRVFLRAHGREIEFGRLLSDEAKLSVAKRLRAKLTALV